MTQEARDRLWRLERVLAVMYADELPRPGLATTENTAWMLGILRAWDQVRTLIETGQVKQFPYEAVAR